MGRLLEVVEATLDESPRRKAFLAQVPKLWVTGPRLQWVQDNPPLDE